MNRTVVSMKICDSSTTKILFIPDMGIVDINPHKTHK